MASDGRDLQSTSHIMVLANRYELLEKIGDGATADVYRARDKHLDRVVAVKLLRTSLVGDVASRMRFTVEARGAAQLLHPNIVTVHDFGEGPDGAMFIAMQYVEGRSLKDYLAKRGRLTPGECVDIACQVCRALEVAHVAGLVHRDVKPQNILVRNDGAVLLADFGIVKTLMGPSLTQAGMTFGTASYMAPEQATGEPVGPPTDLYALGCVMYEMLSGVPPFTGDNPMTVAYKQVWEQPRSLRKVAPEIHQALEAVIMRCLSKEPAGRYVSANFLRAELEILAQTANQPTHSISVANVSTSRHSDRAAVLPLLAQTPVPPSQVHTSSPLDDYQPQSLFTDYQRLMMPMPNHMPGSMPGPVPFHSLTQMKSQEPPKSPPSFQRAPRLYPELPKGEVEIPAPSTPITASSTSLITVILPALFAVASLIATVLIAASGPMVWMMILSFGFMLVSSTTALVSYYSQTNGYKRKVTQRNERYRAILDDHRRELANLQDQQLEAMQQTDPDPRECLMRVERRDRRLWERSPRDNDFLKIRVGHGSLPFAVAVKAPRQQVVTEPDPLVQEAQDLAAAFSYLQGAPIRLSLRELGAAGLVGQRNSVLNTARAMAMQIATHHSPDEVKIVALFPEDEAVHWTWLRWLPHTWADDRTRRFLACEKDSARALLNDLSSTLNRRVSHRQSNGDHKAPPPLPHFVFFLADPRLLLGEPILHLLLTQGPAAGTSSIVLADRIEALPQGCEAIVELGSGQAQLVQNIPVHSRTPCTPDDVPLDLTERFTRSMAPIRLQKVALPTEIPNIVTLFDVLAARSLQELDVATRWRSNEAYRSMAVAVGRRAGGAPLLLDLHERGHGPHGLVAGTVGSGKSELLQSIIASLATNFHPHEVVFVLIDYKGGGMANAFAQLPHLVGTITNLQGNLSARALAALKSELHRRQTVLASAGENHIDKYQQRYRRGEVNDPLPHLLIVADEFAELAAEQPDFMKELISAVRVGRSLGVHLILATQKPAGVVNDQIWSNARFRISLRVERPEDSQEVLRRADAASISSAQSGRAYFQVGNNETFELFQAAWGGSAYAPGVSAPAEAGVMEVSLDGTRHPLDPTYNPQAGNPVSGGSTQLQALVEHLRQVAEQQGLQRLPGPWLPPLPASISLDEVRPAEGWDGQTWRPALGWLEPVVGLVDEPARQYQGPFAPGLGREGHLAIYGAPSMGKTNFVQTLVTSLALTHSPEDVSIYLLDFGGRLLSMFAGLPHVGGVVLIDEEERLGRLLRYLQQEIERRKGLFAQAGANTLVSYRGATGERTAAIVVVLDNYSGFASTYPELEETLAQIVREGGNLGVHLVITANSPTAVRSKITGNISLSVALQLADKGDYAMAVGRVVGLEVPQTAGRGLVKGNPPLEFQTALPINAPNPAARTTRLKDLIEAMSQAWSGPRARPVAVLPGTVALSDLLPPGDAWLSPPVEGTLAVPLGLDVEDLEPIEINLNDGPHFLVTGQAQSGKSTALQAWALALAERFPPERLHLYLVDFRRGPLAWLEGLPHVRAFIDDVEPFALTVTEIAQLVRARRQAMDEARKSAVTPLDTGAFAAQYPALIVIIDDYDCIRDQAPSEAKELLEQLVRRERGLGLHVILAGASADVSTGWEGLVKALKELQTGILLGSEQGDTQMFNLRLPFNEQGKPLSPGQGYYTRRGRYRKIKLASAQAGTVQVRDWVGRLAGRKQRS